MVMLAADPYVALERKLVRRIRDDDSHRRIASALADVALAAIHPTRHAALAGRRAMDSLIEDPVESATRAAIETLIDELEDLVDSLPQSALERLAVEQLASDLGVE